MRIRSGIIAIATLAVLVGVITTLALSSFTAEAQGNSGAIANLQLTSTSAGTLTVSWDATSPTPTDYRVDWAKSGENYTSWKVDDGHKYLTVTSIELTDLDQGVEYKVRARARFYKGEHKKAPWSGPWVEGSLLVSSTPPPAATPKTPVVAPNVPKDDPPPLLPVPLAPVMSITTAGGEVILFWGDPSDDTITGYQILRGPDVDNLAVIEEDAPPSVGRYADENLPRGQWYTYGIKARNASGLSPLSNTENIEVLEDTTDESTNDTLVSNLGQTATLTSVTTGTSGGRRGEDATPFTTGANPFGYHVTDVRIYLARAVGSSTPNPQVSIRSDDAGEPGETVLYTLTTSSTINSHIHQLYEFTTTDGFILKPNTKYWLHITTSGTNAMTAGLTTSDDEDTESRVHWRIGNTRYVRIDGGTWTPGSSNKLRIAISGQVAPTFLVSNMDSPDTHSLLTRQTAADRSKFAQSFSAANNENGTPAEFDFQGVTVRLQSAFTTPEQLADSDILVTVHRDNDDQPGDLVHTLTSPETYSVPLHSGPVTFSAPPGSTLSSGITYWVKFEIADASAYFTGTAGIYFEFATDNNEVQGPAVYNRWSIGDGSLWSPETLSWTEEENSVKMTLLGNPRYATLVSNYGQAHEGAHSLGSQNRVAQSFTTPSTRPGQQYRLGTIRIGIGTERVTPITVDLYSDDGLGDGTRENHSSPDTLLANMFVPDGLATGSRRPIENFVAVAPLNTLLNPETRYWIVVINESETSGVFDNQASISATVSKAEDSLSLNGWTIGDRKLGGTGSPPSWQNIGFPLRMEISGTPTLLRTDEADGPDLPGTDEDAHKGGAVVTPGITSTGHLTPGLDRNHGLYGDYWWLDTERGHSYRIQVKFGDGQRNNTGGSAWTYFIEGDRRGTCCESDHNRDDGFTYLHLKHGEDERDRRYLIDVAAFDKLNYSSRVYNGPYTITMTDITGTEKVATNLYLGTKIDSTLPTIDESFKYAVSFTTEDHPGRYYKLDRVRIHVPYHEALPNLVLHDDASGLPGDGICDLLDPNKVQHHRPYTADNALPVPFRAAHCGRDATLTANTTYWLVLGGTDYEAVFTDSTDQQTRGSGWTIGDRAAISLAGSWESLASDDGTIPVEIWASPTPLPNRHAAGVPLIDGERRVGKTLTADITGITDPEGMSNPRFTYSWIRGDGVDEESITGEESDTYVLTDDDAGERIRTLVTFLDDEEERETAIGPATSLIMPAAARTLVSNFTRGDPNITVGAETTRSTGFVTGSHEFGYVIDSITTYRGVTGTPRDGDAEIQVYDSTSDDNPLNRKPDDLVMTANDFIRVNGYIVAYGAESRVKLDPDTTYHISMVSLIDKPPGCRVTSHDAIDDDSLEGFSIIYRSYLLSAPGMATINHVNRSCGLNLRGFELQSLNFVQNLEFTSSPTQAGMYATGEVIEATATLNQAVTFDGPPPVMMLQVGSNEREMEYVASESTATSWVFRYTVTANDRDDDGISFDRTAIRGYADADLSHRPTPDDREHHVNAAPQLLSHRISSRPDAPSWYGPGERIEFKFEFSLPVSVVGDPELKFNITTPSGDEFAPLYYGTGTKELVFSYYVKNTDDDAEGIWWDENSLTLDSDDSITGTFSGLDVDLEHPEVGILANHRIDQNSRAVSQKVTSDPTKGGSSDTYGAGDVITFEVLFNQPLTVSGSPRLRFSIDGPGDEYATYVSGSSTNTLVFSYTVLSADMDTDGIYLYHNPLDYPDSAADSIVGPVEYGTLPPANEGIGKEGVLPGHKVDGSLTN